MWMPIYFSQDYYLQKALELAKERPESHMSVTTAFFTLVHEASFAQLENLIERIKILFPETEAEEIYRYIQDPSGPRPASGITEELILSCAYECLDSKIPLGNELVPGTSINTSAWMGHCLLEARCCGMLAEKLGLDVEKAMKLGMLHDIGRRKEQNFLHTVRGFEILLNLSYEAEALGCLTHSFINGGRCASNEVAEPGFYVSPEGLPCWEPDAKKDHLTQFLEHYTYTPYDLVLNMADLMATADDIVSPSERIRDIATRRPSDPTNRGYFLAELINLCGLWMDRPWNVKFTSDYTLEQMQEQFEEVSEAFWAKMKKNAP